MTTSLTDEARGEAVWAHRQWEDEKQNHEATKQALADALAEAERVKELLRESYVFITFPHKAHAPWRNALNEWQLRVEAETGWNACQEIENYKSQ